MSQFQVRKDNFNTTRIVETTATPLADGDVRLRVERFAFTANNITYAVTGDMIGYWQFFPPQGDDAEGWGVIPVWGFAEIVESTVAELPVGERIFGYFPPADELVMTPGSITDQRFFDAAEHRAKLPAGYNLYRRATAEPGYDRATDGERMLFWPLFMTAFTLWDWLQMNEWQGAEQVLVLSASSKTSLGLGYALQDDPEAKPSVGLTSARNSAKVEALGIYDSVVAYDNLEALDTTIPTVIVDMSGDSTLLGKLHKALGDNMKFCLNVGITHWDESGQNDDIIADRSEWFFAPGHMQKRVGDWGAEVFEQRSSAFVQASAAKTRSWLTQESLAGLSALSAIYADVSAGTVSPDKGLIVEM